MGALGNLADLEGPLRSLYRDRPDLGAAIRAIEPDLSFAKYLRNVFAGHINDQLIAKSYEWRTELRSLSKIRELSGTIMLNLYVLETAINSYVGLDGRHGKFSSETDLVYPPDMERFSVWLRETIRAAQRVCNDLGAITLAFVAPLSDGSQMFDAYATAGQTDFARIRKRH